MSLIEVSMRKPTVDVTIAVHSATRPIARAVASVIDHTRAAVRVTVVAHNIDPEIIRANLGDYADRPGVRLLALRDNINSPAGPMNLGMDHASAPFHSLLGSDDEFEPGALDSWLELQRSTRASVVIARIRLSTSGYDPYPPVRNGRRTKKLHARKDRLHYRSAPLGLVERARFGDLRLSEGLASGEDLAYASALWLTGGTIAYDLHGPAYVGHDDAIDRVTSAPRPLAADFAFLDEIEGAPWFSGLTRADRRALVVKFIRIHVFDAIAARVIDPGVAAESADLIKVLDRLERMAPGVLRLLSSADRRVIDALRTGANESRDYAPLLAARWNYRSLAALLPRNPALILASQAPLRTLAAGARSLSAGHHDRADAVKTNGTRDAL